MRSGEEYSQSLWGLGPLPSSVPGLEEFITPPSEHRVHMGKASETLKDRRPHSANCSSETVAKGDDLLKCQLVFFRKTNVLSALNIKN